ERVDFNRQVRPILSDNCYFCHGPDAKQRKAELRLDLRESAIASGAIVPEEPDASSLVQRIFAAHGDEQMPPPESNQQLSDAQKELLRRWIAQGAEYQRHWSYEPPVKAAIPDGKSGVDHLVQQQLTELGLKPAPPADRRTLIRRLHFDLLGLPPSPDDV